MRAAPLFLLVLLAVGCVQATTSAPPTAAASGGPSILLRGCANASGVFPVPLDEARALLPPGFAPVATGASPADGAAFDVVAARCASATVDGVDVGSEALVAYAELEVAPPPALRVEGLDDYVAPVLLVASPPALGDAFAALHLGRSGAGTIERQALPTGGVAYVATLPNGDGFRLAAQTTTGNAALPAGVFRVFAIQDHALAGVVNGTYSSGRVTGAALAMHAEGAPPLLAHARPAARGGAVNGFDLGFAPSS